ncbi:RNA-binding protein [Panacibacter sp. DH6]|uniref:RNA-binding protein n=1 Tax=Panacibacter microcysteis TaxID=2793269 RepID=A0A931GZG8_9BACT|nr:RNA-binding protein [Panacibacter microcysteis]MBG9378212.1 RNA-binding protein [Panacibacter microcysteis]
MNIYVSNLSFHTTEEDLVQMFSAYGSVNSAKIVIDKFTNKSRGFGFIEMPDDNAAQEAISKLNNKDIQGRTLSVSVARPREERPGGFRSRSL